MTSPIAAAVTAQVQAAVTQPQMLQSTGASPAGDLERLRALVANSTPTVGYVEAAPAPPPEAVEKSAFRSLGDSILESISSFNSGYNQSLDTINTKLEAISGDKGSLDLGSNFDEVMGLQVEIARWSMSVMGVDNASKAGTNTVKELSKGA
jgi:FlaG/FlaF family flagellin (archaellin)